MIPNCLTIQYGIFEKGVYSEERKTILILPLKLSITSENHDKLSQVRLKITVSSTARKYGKKR